MKVGGRPPLRTKEILLPEWNQFFSLGGRSVTRSAENQVQLHCGLTLLVSIDRASSDPDLIDLSGVQDIFKRVCIQ